MNKIYLLQVGNYYKIGYTKNDVNKRVKQLQTGSPDIITIRHIFHTKHGMKVERSLHSIYSHKRISGEFFDLEYNDISQFIEICERFERALDATLSQT